MLIILSVSLLAAGVLAHLYLREKSALEGLKKELEVFKKYKHIQDAEVEAKNIIDAANSKLKSADEAYQQAESNIQILKAQQFAEVENEILVKKKLAESYLVDSRIKGREILMEAENRLIDSKKIESDLRLKIIEESKGAIKEAQEKAKLILEKASLNEMHSAEVCRRIIKSAEVEAKKMDAEILSANRNVEELRGMAKALTNIIEGYGDKYFLPTCSLLEELESSYSHVEAGQSLKAAKAASVLLVTNGTAADNDYAEEARRKTAIEFVLDAFNGKVESILSTLKPTNYGNLKQEIIDCFHIINQHGAAFKNARITRVYLDSRLEELRCAATLVTLREKERDEQRAIRDQMREEAKAEKEFEKAMRDAEKEEQKLNKMLEIVKADLAKASEKEKEIFEAKLRDLEFKLIEEKEKNKRALSMAQQTKKGNVYIISNIGSFGEQVFKIGMTRRLVPQDRIDELGDASVPFDFDVHAMIPSEDAPALEKQLHHRFGKNQINKVNPRKEFFRVDLTDLKKTVEDLGINVSWTLISEAKEYRDSLYLENEKEVA